MKPFVSFKEIEDRDFYEIRGGFIHVLGYYYFGDRYEYNEPCWFRMSLDEFVEGFAKDGIDFVNEWYMSCKTYITEFSGEDEAIEHANIGIGAYSPLSFALVNFDTHDGLYIN